MSNQSGIPIKITMPNGKMYHESVEEFQREFHNCGDKFRWLGGGVGGGKSAAATVEALIHSWCYPNNYGFILRKTFPELRLSAIKDFYEITPSWMIVEDNRQEHWVDVLNYEGFDYYDTFIDDVEARKMRKRDYLQGLRDIHGTSRIEFISFEGTEAAEQKFRSANIGWYMIEQAEEASPIIYDRLNERLRRVPSGRQAWFISNPDGKDWLWDFFSPDSPIKRDGHTLFEVELSDNSNLPDDFHETLKDTYTEEDYARLVEGSFAVATDAVFPEFSLDMHLIPHFEPPDEWEKCFSLDHGLDNPTAALHITKWPSGIVYIYSEYYENEKYIAQHAAALMPTLTPEHRIKTIDPTCVNRTPFSGQTIIGEYARAGIHFIPGVRDMNVGINRIKEYLKFDPDLKHPITGEMGSPRLLISDRCLILPKEFQRLKWDTVKTDRGAKNRPEKPKDFFDHLIAALRWGLLAFTPYRSSKSYVSESPKRSFTTHTKAHEHKHVDKDGNFSIEAAIQSSLKNSRDTSWSRRRA